MLIYSYALYSQTNPGAQSLPYGQDFSSLAHSSTTYLSGWQGWQVTTTLSGSFNTSAPTADKTLTASSSASTTSGNVHNYNGKIGCLNSGSSGDLSLVLSVNTSSKSNVQVKYDVMTIRNPYDGTSNTRINEVTLQYRVGTSGAFTTLTGIEYQNNTSLSNTSGSTTPQNSETKTITLPSACDNQSEVQLRWISRQVSGAGSRPSFALDNISVQEVVIKSLNPLAIANATESSSPIVGSFSITFSPATTNTSTFDYSFSGTATFSTDYTVSLNGGTPSIITSSSGSISVPSDSTEIIISITPIDDNTAEGSETVILTISNPSDSFVISDPSETITIIDDDPTLIHDIQGSGSAAVAGGNLIEAIVTGVYPGLSPAGFYVQEEDNDADANNNTSEGIFVASTTSVAIGDKVRVSGTVLESGASPSFGQAVIHNCTVTVISNGNSLPTASVINLPISSVSDYEKYECMLVHFPDTLTVTDNFNLGRFGEIKLSFGGLVFQPTQVVDPNDSVASGNTSIGSSNVAAVNALNLKNILRTILLDDGTGTMNTLPYVNSDNNLRLGSTTKNLKGIMGYGFSSYRIQPIPSATPSFKYASRPNLPSVGSHNIKVTSFNVLNYFNGDGLGGGFPTSRGAHSLQEFNRQRTKIINAIAAINADVVGLTEIENDGTDSNSAIVDLVNGLNLVMGAGTYDFIRDGESIQTFGTDAIRCAIIYKPAKVKPQGRVLLSSSSTFNRPPVSQTFTALETCSDFSFVINHFKSKSATGATGADIDQLDGQSAYNDRRKLQSSSLVDFIRDSVVALSGSNRVISMGDYNAYFEEDPMDILRDSGYKILSSATSYSYQFNGQIGSLDHAFVSSSILPFISGVAKWNLNAAEPTHLGYDDSINDGSGDFVNRWGSSYTSIPYRSSDHDPVIVGIKFKSESPYSGIKVVPSNNIYTGGIATNLYIGYGPQSDTLKAITKGGIGFTYNWNPDSLLSCSDCKNPVFTPTKPGNYTFTLFATNSKGCVAKETVTICVKNVKVPNNNKKVYICHNGKTNQISINSVNSHLKNHDDDFLGKCDDYTCGRNSYCGSKRSEAVSVSENESNDVLISVYPNPASDLLFVNLPSEIENANITLFDMAGKVVKRMDGVNGLVQLSVGDLAQGVYMIEVQYGDVVYRIKIMHN